MSHLRLPPLPTVKDIIKLYRLSAIKQLSQNFLLNERITDRIVKYTGRIADSQVLEVGPGPGAITKSILKRCPKRLIVVEKDKRFKPTLDLLADAFSVTGGKMEATYDDIMSFRMENLFDGEPYDWTDDCPNIYLVGNLPFSLSTALIIKWLHGVSERRGAWSKGRVRMTLTFQKEVAERLVAEADGEHRCRLSVMAQAWTIPKLRFIIPGKEFVPKPDVDVGVVSFIPLKQPRTHHEFKFFEKVNRHMFSFRQKYSIKCAGTLFPVDSREHLSSAMYKLADMDPQKRPIEMTVEDISRLATAYKYLCEKHPEIVDYNYRASRKVLSTKLTKSVQIEDYLEDESEDDRSPDEDDRVYC